MGGKGAQLLPPVSIYHPHSVGEVGEDALLGLNFIDTQICSMSILQITGFEEVQPKSFGRSHHPPALDPPLGPLKHWTKLSSEPLANQKFSLRRQLV